MNKLSKGLQWLDNNLLKLGLLFFIFFIPLYPKFPIRIIDYTYIAIRLDDIVTAVLAILFAIQLFRKKATINKNFLPLFVLFWVAVMLSYVWNFFISGEIIHWHLGLLHGLRRVEYMIVFFIAAATIKSKKDLLHMLTAIMIALSLVSIYGIGQKYFGLPAVQTMNPEFAKGALLYLTPEARVSSTFAGHYDLAAYYVFIIPIALGIMYMKRNYWYFLTLFFAIFTLFLTASRTSTIAYAVGTFPYLVWTRKFIMLVVIGVLSVACGYASENLTSRIGQTFQIKQIFVNEQTGEVVVPQKTGIGDLPAGTFFIEIKDDAFSDKKLPRTQEEIDAANESNKQMAKEQILADIRQEASKSGKILTSTEEAMLVEERAGGLRAINTVVSDVATAIRYQVSWPRAINAFKTNPILGTGPSSLTEATDGNYFRWIGEFGLFGTIVFLLIIGKLCLDIWLARTSIPFPTRMVYLGYLFGTFSLMVNATYIDVFEASKVAYHFWLISGILIGAIPFVIDKTVNHKK